MNLESALELRERIIHEVSLVPEDKQYMFNIPTSCVVMTEDGQEYYPMYFSGSYEERGETVVTSHQIWEEVSLQWKQRIFNSDGIWRHRRAVNSDKKNSRMDIITLDCGHPQYSNPRHHSSDQDYECYRCMLDGVGWDDSLMRQGA